MIPTSPMIPNDNESPDESYESSRIPMEYHDNPNFSIQMIHPDRIHPVSHRTSSRIIGPRESHGARLTTPGASEGQPPAAAFQPERARCQVRQVPGMWWPMNGWWMAGFMVNLQLILWSVLVYQPLIIKLFSLMVNLVSTIVHLKPDNDLTMILKLLHGWFLVN